jgi:hypothetical protein
VTPVSPGCPKTGEGADLTVRQIAPNLLSASDIYQTGQLTLSLLEGQVDGRGPGRRQGPESPLLVTSPAVTSVAEPAARAGTAGSAVAGAGPG